MGIADVKNAFNDGLGGKADCVSASMTYAQGGKQQVLTFVVAHHAGGQVTLTDTIDATTNIVTHAHEMAVAHALTLP